jgi:hypothetical protein
MLCCFVNVPVHAKQSVTWANFGIRARDTESSAVRIWAEENTSTMSPCNQFQDKFLAIKERVYPTQNLTVGRKPKGNPA